MSVFDLQDAVVIELNNAFSGQFVATAEFTPDFTLEDAEVIKVPVVPGNVESVELMNRSGTVQDVLEVQVGIIQRVADNAEARTVLALADTVRKHFKSTLKLSLGPIRFLWHGVSMMPIYDYDSLEDEKKIVSIISLKYKEFVT